MCGDAVLDWKMNKACSRLVKLPQNLELIANKATLLVFLTLHPPSLSPRGESLSNWCTTTLRIVKEGIG